jgi:circadian clock protein KaiC
MHMVQGVAGTGKTTLALHFLNQAAGAGEPTVYVTLSQSREHLDRIARSHGWSIEGITVHELSPRDVADRVASRQTILPTVEVELDELFGDLTELVDRIRPRRAVIDSITLLQLLAGGVDRYHREVVTLRQLFVERGCTLMALADHPAEGSAGQRAEVIFHPLCGVVVELMQRYPSFGDIRRQVRVVKSRGMASHGGFHDLKIRTGGMEVFPRMRVHDTVERDESGVLPSGIPALDETLGGGLEFGMSNLFVGPPGAGKSTLASLFAAAAADRGDRVAIYLFDERPETYKRRAEGLGIPLARHAGEGRIHIRQLDPAEIAPGEFAQQVKEAVENDGIRFVVIDSVVGYFTAVGSSELFVGQLHELLTYLSRSGVLTILAGSQEGFMSIGTQQGVDISYLSDTIVVFGYFEVEGTVRRFVTPAKRRQGEVETTIRELSISSDGVSVGEPLREFQNILLKNPLPAKPRPEQSDDA